MRGFGYGKLEFRQRLGCGRCHDAKMPSTTTREVDAGSGERGRVALGGRGPLGYHGDPDKSAETFRVIYGERWTISGDYANVRADGTVQLLGPGLVCTNTGGEKVFPEEVEEVIKRHPAVADAVIVGVPDDHFGERVVAVVESEYGAREVADRVDRLGESSDGPLQGAPRCRTREDHREVAEWQG